MHPDVERALIFAAVAHKGQLRKGLDEPYINHPAGVMEDAIAVGLSVDAQVAAVLHDVVEDTGVTFQTLEQADFSPRARLLVRLLTKWWKTSDVPPDVAAVYRTAYYAAILTDPDATTLKLLDRARNLTDAVRIVDTRLKWVSKYFAKTLSELEPLRDANLNEGAGALYYRALGALERVLLATALPIDI